MDADKLGPKMDKAGLTINGWMFAYEYPGFYAFYKDDRTVYCTPDNSIKGQIDIQYVDADGNLIGECDSVPYGRKLTQESFTKLMEKQLTEIERRFQ